MSRVNLSFDIWTAPNNVSLLGVVGHWIDKHRQMKTALLGLKELVKDHGGADQEPLLRGLIYEYEIGQKLSAFQMDNADNNDVCLNLLAESFNLSASKVRLRY